MGSIRAHVRGNIVGYVALFFALSASAYAAGLAPDSVRSKHIKDGQVQQADIAPDAIVSSNVLNGSLGGSDLGSNTVGGQQIAESTLGEVPNATIAGHGGYGRSGSPGSCDPTDALYITCASVTLNPSAPARFLVTATFTAQTDGSDEDDEGTGTCRLGSSTSGGIPDTPTGFGLVSPKDSRYGSERMTVTAITDDYGPGNYTFGLDCKEAISGIHIVQARVTAVAISPF